MIIDHDDADVVARGRARTLLTTRFHWDSTVLGTNRTFGIDVTTRRDISRSTPRPAIEAAEKEQVEPLPAPATSGPLDTARPGDAIVILALVPAPTLRAVTPEADSVLHESLGHIVGESVPAGARVVPWPEGRLLVVLPRTTRAHAVAMTGEVRRRWHCSWTAPVAVASGVSVVDATTSADTAAMRASAEVNAAKGRVGS
jgi:hypothetical protein